MVKAKSILKNKFGYQEFRSLQEEVINNVLTKKDTLAIMPTGGGKSLCYQIPALIFEGLTVVISPLISLMKDQVEQLDELNIDAIFLNSSLKKRDYQKNSDLVRDKKVKLLYLAPETYMMEATQTLLKSVRVDCITIDEAHCVSEWGHDFRPEYMKISSTREHFPDAVCLALTATATPRVQDDIISSLQFKVYDKFLASFDRPNLFLKVIPKVDPLKQTVDYLSKNRKKPGIIYCFKRKQVETLCEELQALGFSARPYHAGLSDKDRETNQELFLKDEIQIIVATIAFGMGINKPNVRFVVHFDLPKSMESYYQEIGRAGRDGLRSECLLLFSYTDIAKFKYLLKKKEEKERNIAEKQIDSLVEYLEYQNCRRGPLLKYFGETFEKTRCNGYCDNCLSQITGDADISEYAYKYLYCVKETGEEYGLSYITNLLRGSKEDIIFKNGHDDLNSYNTGKSLQRNQWSIVARQLVEKGFLNWDQKKDKLELTAKGIAFIHKQYAIDGRLSEEAEDKSQNDNGKAKSTEEIFAGLNELRKEYADDQGIPPYAVITEESLHELSKMLPKDKEEFLSVPGITEFKYKKYGVDFIKKIIKLAKLKTDDDERNPDNNKFIQIGEKYNKGMPIREIAEEFDIKYSLVLDNLYHYIQSGGKLNKIDWLALRILGKETLDKVTATFDAMGCQNLENVLEHFEGNIGIDHLKIIRLYYLNEN
ncbi:DNA helicase RecQ [Candidatus Kapabacteria bacterium]|nr:DNA helicase RecQ [Candidatus Kapabacteria bacterium]